jgi:hypothetical protein
LSTLSVAEFRKQVGTAEADTILQEIIDQAEREIQGWIDMYSLTTTVTKASSSLLSKAGWYERLHLTGGLPGESGAKYYSLDKKAENLRLAAKALVFETIEEEAAATSSNYSVKKANA